MAINSQALKNLNFLAESLQMSTFNGNDFVFYLLIINLILHDSEFNRLLACDMWQTLTSYLIWTMIESMERLTSKKQSIIPGKIKVFWLVRNALAWFRCHANDRKKQVTCKGHPSSTRTVTLGVFQGSILKLLLFIEL